MDAKLNPMAGEVHEETKMSGCQADALLHTVVLHEVSLPYSPLAVASHTDVFTLRLGSADVRPASSKSPAVMGVLEKCAEGDGSDACG